jgi:hypothetical protein
LAWSEEANLSVFPDLLRSDSLGKHVRPGVEVRLDCRWRFRRLAVARPTATLVRHRVIISLLIWGAHNVKNWTWDAHPLFMFWWVMSFGTRWHSDGVMAEAQQQEADNA